MHQPNGGHGAGVMAGVRLATGTYFKIVDSDDWVDDEGYQEVLNTVRKLDMERNQYNKTVTIRSSLKTEFSSGRKLRNLV